MFDKKIHCVLFMQNKIRYI